MRTFMFLLLLKHPLENKRYRRKVSEIIKLRYVKVKESYVTILK